MLRSVLVPFGRLSVYLVVGAVAALMILPFYWMIITAFMPAPDILAFPPQWLPTRLTLEQFVVAFAQTPWLTYS